MPYDPAKPANNTNASSAEMRAQLQALNADIQTRTTAPAVNGAIASAISGTANNSNAVQTFNEQGVTFSDSESQQIADKLGELILALWR